MQNTVFPSGGLTALISLLLSLLAFSSISSAAPLSQTIDHSLDFYGTLIARRFMSPEASDAGDRSYLYFGLKGTRRVGYDWQAYGQWEYTVSMDDASRNATRLAFLGIRNPALGSLDIGRNWGVLYDVTSLTDRSPLFREMSYYYVDNVMRGRAEDLLTYRQNFNLWHIPAQLAFQYQFPCDQTNRPITKRYGKGLGASLIISLSPYFSAFMAISSSSATFAQEHVTGYQKKIQTEALGLRYQSPDLYLALVTTRSNNSIRPESSSNAHLAFSEEMLVKVMFTNKLQPHIGYTRLRQNLSERRQDVLNYEEIGLTYYFNKSMQFFMDYKLNNSRQLHSQTDAINKAEIGLSYHW